MDFDNPKVYGDTSISDGLVCIQNMGCKVGEQEHITGVMKLNMFEGFTRVLSVSFLFRTSGKEYHSQAGSTKKWRGLGCI